MPLYLVSAQAVCHARIWAQSPQEAARLWLEWRQRLGGELHSDGVHVLLRLDEPVKITDAGGKPVGEIRGGRDFYPAGGDSEDGRIP